jgi:ATP-binding cassette subfamily B protein
VEETLSKQKYDPRLLRRLLALVVPYWPAVLTALVCLLGNSVLQVASPLLTKIAIDRYLKPGGESTLPWLEAWLPAGAQEGLIAIAWLYLFSIVGSLVLEFGEQYLMQRTGQHAMFDLRRRLFAHLQRLDITYYDRNPVGRMVTRVTTDVDALNELFASGIVTILGDILVLTAIFLAMFRLSPDLTLMLVGVLPMVLVVTVVFRRAVQASNRQIRIAVARINSFLQEHVTGIAVLQLFNREARAAADFEKVNRQHLEAYRGAIQAYGWFYPAVELISMISLVALLIRGGYQVRGGEVSLGIVVAFFQYGMRIFRPIQDLSEKYNILQSALAAAERIFQLLDEPVKVASEREKTPFPQGPAAIEFDRVWFAYKGEEWILHDVSFRIEPGETIAVVGHTGAGKTTLTNLLLRFYDIQQGAIRLGGVDIRSLDLHELRAHFAIVLQDPTLFTGTLADNIRLGTPRISGEDMERAAAQVNLREFLDSLPKRLEHEVRERGAGLSTGQKQLISFARALSHDPEFLILDEATSSVDTETEHKVRDALDHMVEGRTSLVIAHRLSTVQRADRILVMHKGRLREQGTHQQLLAARGIYWKLYQLQYQDQESPPRA